MRSTRSAGIRSYRPAWRARCRSWTNAHTKPGFQAAGRRQSLLFILKSGGEAEKSGYLERDIGERERRNMKRKINYTDGPIGEYKVITDFLPSPEHLIKKETNVKVTINLRKDSVDFFKSIAKKNNVQYQKVIRGLLNSYAESFSHQR
jgi:predicted DNA binding CopG/RHH family protein